MAAARFAFAARRALALAICAFAASGCMMMAPLMAVPAAAVMLPSSSNPDEHPNAPGKRKVPRALPGHPSVAVALGSGSMRGFAHVGVVAALEEAGIRPALVVGTSAGSVVGSLWASGLPAGQIARASEELDWTVLVDIGLPRRGLVGGSRVEEFVRRHAGGLAIEALPVAFAAVATDARTGEAVVLDEGDAAFAVRASTGIPVVFEPVRARGRLLVDGSLSAPTPVRIARDLGADLVIAVNVAWSPQEATLRNPLDMLFQTMQLMAHNLNRAELSHADVVIAPDIRPLGPIGTGSREALMVAGKASALAAIPAIRSVVERWRLANATRLHPDADMTIVK